MLVLLIVLGVAIGIVLFAIALYNGLVRQRQEVKNAWSQIDVQLKRRYDLIPNLVETAKGYIKHERETLEKVIQARNQAMGATGVAEKAQAENALTGTLRNLFAVAEAYPDLKANTNMLALQEELTSTENRIAFARQFYNDRVMGYNTSLQTVPTNIVASLTGFTREEFFETESPAERQTPKVQF